MSTTEDKQLIQLSVSNWSQEKRMAVAKLTSEALRYTTYSLGNSSWAAHWWSDMLAYLQLEQQDLDRHLTTERALALVSSEKDIRIDSLVDLLALALLLVPENEKKSKRPNGLYDARERRFLIELEHIYKLERGDLKAVERSVSQQMYYALQKDQEDNMGSSTKKAVEEANGKKKAFRWLATGGAVLGGGAVIALTGGLAAPLLAPLIAGATGLTFFATAGGVALVTSLFGLTGGGLTGWKMHRRVKNIEDFEFKQILTDPDLPPIPALHCTICISGFLLEDQTETHKPWEKAFENRRNGDDVYCLEYEKETLLELGYSFKKFVRDTAVNYAGMEVAKATVLNAFFAAVALPLTVMKLGYVIDNPWLIAADKSKKAGTVLADVLEQKVQGNRPCNLVGYSCGCLVIWHCLLELQKRGCLGIVDNVVMMGAPISLENMDEWNDVMSVVSGRFINCYTSKDWVLAYVFRLHSFSSEVAGLQPVKLNRMENIEVDIDGHTKYPEIVKEMMDQIRLE
ncbi:DUF726-domain-containing protein [Backusella circina FSU 941]|nr:DUF726-domain-containing protein [Backusella circina FSU 941]